MHQQNITAQTEDLSGLSFNDLAARLSAAVTEVDEAKAKFNHTLVTTRGDFARTGVPEFLHSVERRFGKETVRALESRLADHPYGEPTNRFTMLYHLLRADVPSGYSFNMGALSTLNAGFPENITYGDHPSLAHCLACVGSRIGSDTMAALERRLETASLKGERANAFDILAEFDRLHRQVQVPPLRAKFRNAGDEESTGEREPSLPRVKLAFA